MDDDYTILAAPVPDPAPPSAESDPDTLPFPPPIVADDGPRETFLLRGYDAPGDYFQPRLRANGAA